MKQSQALDILLSGSGVFLTGEPGAGKSFTIREFMKQTRRRVALTALTGIAATQIGGQTIHAWSGIGARRALTPSDVYAIKNGLAGARIRASDTLVIDEVSMLSGDFLQMLDYVWRVSRGWHKLFGGLQVILVGDFFQLPPVIKETAQFRFTFEAPAWEALDPAVCYLTEQHRQADLGFLGLLSSIRSGRCDPQDARLWSRHAEDAPGDIPFLSTHNTSVDASNAARLKELPGRAMTF
jgi:ATP-dependent exoDNAse (exonuclease V) alpha subunit